MTGTKTKKKVSNKQKTGTVAKHRRKVLNLPELQPQFNSSPEYGFQNIISSSFDKDGDAIMEPVLSSKDEDEEDDERKLHMSMLLLVSFVATYFEAGLTKEWTAPIYAFFLPTPVIKYSVGINDRDKGAWNSYIGLHWASGI